MFALYKENGELKLSSLKVKYEQHGEVIEKYVLGEGRKWWEDFNEKWDNVILIEFNDVSHTAEQLTRFENVKNISANEEILNDYILEGIFPEGVNHPLRNIQVEKDMSDMFFEIMMGGM